MAGIDFFDEYMDKITGRVSTTDPQRCWIWRGAVHGKVGGPQYGVMRVRFPGETTSKPTEVQRVVYMYKLRLVHLPKTDARGEKLEVSHLCGLSLCCNPAHLTYEPHIVNNNRLFCFNRGHCFGHKDHPNCVSPSNMTVLLITVDFCLQVIIITLIN